MRCNNFEIKKFFGFLELKLYNKPWIVLPNEIREFNSSEASDTQNRCLLSSSLIGCLHLEFKNFKHSLEETRVKWIPTLPILCDKYLQSYFFNTTTPCFITSMLPSTKINYLIKLAGTVRICWQLCLKSSRTNYWCFIESCFNKQHYFKTTKSLPSQLINEFARIVNVNMITNVVELVAACAKGRSKTHLPKHDSRHSKASRTGPGSHFAHSALTTNIN